MKRMLAIAAVAVLAMSAPAFAGHHNHGGQSNTDRTIAKLEKQLDKAQQIRDASQESADKNNDGHHPKQLARALQNVADWNATIAEIQGELDALGAP